MSLSLTAERKVSGWLSPLPDHHRQQGGGTESQGGDPRQGLRAGPSRLEVDKFRGSELLKQGAESRLVGVLELQLLS